MKALVLGTSNSVMREGWLSLTREMASQQGLHYDNQSIGVLPSLYLAYRLQDLHLVEDVDRVVIDFCINDQIHMGSGIYDLDRAEGHYMAAFRQLSQSRMLSKTLVLIFTQQQLAISGAPCPLIERLKILCARFRIKTLDAKELISDAAKVRREDIGQAYRDPMHFAPPYQQLMGEEVLRRLQQRPTRMVGLRVWANRRALRTIPFACIRSLRVEPTAAHSIENVGTSLARRDVMSLPHGSHATVSGGRWLLGLFHWTHPNAGAFWLKSRDEERRFHVRRVWPKRLFVFDALKVPFPLNSPAEPSGATLHVSNPNDIPYIIMIGQRSSIYDCTGTTVDLVDLVGSDLSPDELSQRIAECHTLCATSPLSRLTRTLWNRLLQTKIQEGVPIIKRHKRGKDLR